MSLRKTRQERAEGLLDDARTLFDHARYALLSAHEENDKAIEHHTREAAYHAEQRHTSEDRSVRINTELARLA